MNKVLVTFFLIMTPCLVQTTDSSASRQGRGAIGRLAAAGTDWCYVADTAGSCKEPSAWNTLANSVCGGKSQSPVNIARKAAVLDYSLKKFVFEEYDKDITVGVVNNGYTVEVNLAQSGAKISGGKLNGKYKALQFHLHWGKAGENGSEHQIDAKQFPAELHIVHMKDTFTSIADALKEKDGVAVLGFFYEVSKDDNSKYAPLIDVLSQVATPTGAGGASTGEAVTTAASEAAGDRQGGGSIFGAERATGNVQIKIKLSDFIPSTGDLTKYYRYDGSLTTPNCDEAVVWTLFETKIKLSATQIGKFPGTLKTKSGAALVKNFRPLQALNDRKVYWSGCSSLSPGIALLLLSSISTLGLTIRFH
ncbi:carbonic anhydrase 4a [Polypterus senegalus]|uniref:carbonic anhydrase 4a n=1 Tax=Polypterus senegalus TaxID=55291 RepID=UPI001962676E|nr:carbonic anhydrase 4a [Polypterus senegalus]